MNYEKFYTDMAHALQTMINDAYHTAAEMDAGAEESGGRGHSEELAGKLVAALLDAKELADQLARRASGKN